MIKLPGYMKKIYIELRISYGKTHEYLGIDLDFSISGKVKFSINAYTKKIVEFFAKHIGNTPAVLASDHMFYVRAE